MGKEKQNIPEILKESKETFIERSKIHKDAFSRVGKMMVAVFPDGLTLNTEEDFNRFYAFMMSMNKLNRYAS